MVATGLMLSRAIAITERSGQLLKVLYMHPYWPTGDFPTPFLPLPTLPLPALNRLGHRVFQKAFEMSDRPNVTSMRRRVGLAGGASGTFRYCEQNGVDVVNAFSPALVPRPSDWPESHTIVDFPVIGPTIRAALGKSEPDPGLDSWLQTGESRSSSGSAGCRCWILRRSWP